MKKRLKIGETLRVSMVLKPIKEDGKKLIELVPAKDRIAYVTGYSVLKEGNIINKKFIQTKTIPVIKVKFHDCGVEFFTAEPFFVLSDKNPNREFHLRRRKYNKRDVRGKFTK